MWSDMDFSKMTDEQLLEIIEKKYGNALKNWSENDPAVIEFVSRISVGE